MKTIEIKGIVPGSGKTETLTTLFSKAHLNNKIILTPSNKARQECIKRLEKNGIEPKVAENFVKTFRLFKQNFYENKKPNRVMNMESGEMEETVESLRYITTHSSHHYKKVWNIFIDEGSMISKEEMDDLLKSWKIQNLVIDGDSLQFEPISNIDILKHEDETISEWIDEGKPYSLDIDTQVLLNKSMRAKDENLVKVLEKIKEGRVVDAMIDLYIEEKGGHAPIDCENKGTDWHIAYTNNRCNQLNSMYKNPKRFIVVQNDRIHGFCKSEILNEDDPRFEDLKRRLLVESLENDKVPSFEEWKRRFLKPAYAITCHKLQGSTIIEGDIFIHLDDLVGGLLEKYLNAQEIADLFQKYLYVAVSRAVSIKQINLYGGLFETKKGNTVCVDFYEYFKKNGENSSLNVELFRPMVDTSISDSAKEFAADDPSLIDYLLESLEYDERNASILEGEEKYLEDISKAHSKPHKPHKPHKSKYTDEYLESFEDLEDLRKVTKNQKVINRWKVLKGAVQYQKSS